MKKLLLLFLVSFIFQSCGFQSRKYTSGHYGHFYKKESVDKGHSLHIDRTSSVEIEFADDSHERHDCAAQVMEHGDQVKLSPEHLPLIKIEKEKKQISRDAISSDTIKINLHRTEEEKRALQPPANIQSLVLTRRRDTLYDFLSLSLAITFLSIWSDHGYAVAGILMLLFLLIKIWRSTHPIFDIYRMRMLMRNVSKEEKQKKWFRRMKIKNTLAACLLPIFILTFFFSIIAFLNFTFEIIVFGF
jgi:hypothetical protein